MYDIMNIFHIERNKWYIIEHMSEILMYQKIRFDYTYIFSMEDI
jgi:hypothetical protein